MTRRPDIATTSLLTLPTLSLASTPIRAGEAVFGALDKTNGYEFVDLDHLCSNRTLADAARGDVSRGSR